MVAETPVRLWLLVGASGSGKDSLLRWLNQAIARGDAPPTVRIAQRIITRPPEPNEAHLALDPQAFERVRAAGRLALWWEAHGCYYGIGTVIDAWLAQGDTVIVNGSRAHLAQALARYPNAGVLEVQVAPAVQAQRLQARGREDAAAIAARLARTVPLDDAHRLTARRWVVLHNDGPLDATGAALLQALLQR